MLYIKADVIFTFFFFLKLLNDIDFSIQQEEPQNKF